MAVSIIIKKGGLSLPGGRGPRARIPGVFPAVTFGEQVLSTGIPSLDDYIGGGVGLGTILVIEDAFPCRYADLVLKSFLAEGASYNHHLFVGSTRVTSENFAKELPSRRKETGSTGLPSVDPDNIPSDKGENEKLKIAWRYRDATPLHTTLSSRGGIIKGQKSAKFEFTKKCTAKDLGGQHLNISNVLDEAELDPPSPMALLREITEVVKPFDLTQAEGIDRVSNNLIRIGLSHCEDQVFDPCFMMGLTALVRFTNSAAVITVSNLSQNDGEHSSQLEHLADSVIRLQVILDDRKKADLGDVDGLCSVVKLSSVNSLKMLDPPTDLGFSFRKKRLTFQELHIPPEGETTAQREVASHSKSILKSGSASCGTSVQGKSIDF